VSDDDTYSVTVRCEFVAWHFLIGGDFGPENERNAHRYRVEARYEGPDLDQHGFLLEIDDVQRRLDAVTDRYEAKTLNDLAEFEGLNPSVEHFARIIGDMLAVRVPNVRTLEVTVWEDDSASAGHRRQL
jgi:6-pyruvoyltetrahydropterin/6-carboxytetrahydropterin synthase